MKRLQAALALGLAAVTLVPGNGLRAAEVVQEGPALALEIRTNRPLERVEVRGMIRVRRPDGRRVSAPFSYRTENQGALWEAVYETPGAGELPAQKLTVTFSESRPPVYLMSDAPGEGATVRQYLGADAMIPFAGSDFWLADLGMHYLHWPDQRVMREAKIRMRKGRPCHVLESRNPEPGAKGYTRVVSYIDRETGKPILAEAFGPDGKVQKEFEIGGVTKVDGVWQLKNMEMRDLKEDSVTVLEFQYEQKE